ncbi:uncharacterized protein mfsd8l2 isoform X4 [Denticeps clupeoides]|uniref:uncharacterized protein mfsd8l2 isoform X4 n=1 Tax=Denticeps clupeoides TaxID=299321 RepID=UPI0010A37459|nr:uncharacterized protein LOC114787507 isoform X4 [Denticeps clupeoides]
MFCGSIREHHVFCGILQVVAAVQSSRCRHWRRCRFLHLWLPDHEHGSSGACASLRRRHGVPPGGPSDWCRARGCSICTVYALCLFSNVDSVTFPGPAFNIFLRLCDFSLGPFVVDKYTSPGLFMCALWLLLELLVFLLYWDLPPPESAELHTLVQRLHDEEEEAEEEPLLMSPEDPMDTYGTVNTDESNAQPETPPSPPTPPLTPPDPFQNFSMSNEFLREEVVVLLTAQFITLFNQTALETMVTPLTQRYFGFGELGNSVMYSLCGVEVILGFFFVRWLSRVVADRAVLAVGLVTCSVACVWCIVFLANPRGGFSVELLEFVVGVFLQLLGLPFVAVSQVSLFSKVTAEKTQGFSQGVRRSVGGLATILGPLWAGGLTANLYVMLGMMLVLLTLVTVSRRPRAAQLVASAESRPGDPDGLVCCR